MANPFREKIIDEKEKKEPGGSLKLMKLQLLSDLENVEIKKLEADDVDEVYLLMRKTLWESTKEQVTDVIKSGMSYGAYVERMLAGAGLAWSARYEEGKGIVAGENNAIYMEDVALLLAYEGKGIRKMLIEEREKQAKLAGFAYAVAYISPDWPQGDLAGLIKERGNKIEREYLAAGYKFERTKDGIVALKGL
ncbi:Uncharacterised protein [uncultured archaeon]|nr:Uncharacterised protein [uncultured archaeon]